MSARRNIKLAPLTIAVGAGPLIDALTYVASSEGGLLGIASQWIRGLLIMLMLASIADAKQLARKSRPVMPILLLGAYGLLLTVARGDAYEAIVLAMRVLFVSVVYVCAAELTSRGLLGARWIKGIALSVLFWVLLSQAVGRALNVVSVYRGEFVFPGVTGEPTMIANALAASLPLFLVRVPLAASDAVGAAIAVTSVAATQRRSAIVAALVMSGLYGVRAIAKGSVRTALRASALLVLLGLAGYALATWTPLGTELASRFEDANVAAGGTGSGRMEFQRIVLERIRERSPTDNLFGEGWGAVRDVIEERFGLSIGAHSDWLDIVYGLGVVGGVLFFWFHVRLVRIANHIQEPGRAVVLIALAGLAVIEITAGGVLTPTMAPTFALLGAVIGMRRRDSRQATVRMHYWASRPNPSPDS